MAIKKVLQDKRYKNRELQIMKLLDHPNVVALRHCFFSTTEKDELYLNLVSTKGPEWQYRPERELPKLQSSVCRPFRGTWKRCIWRLSNLQVARDMIAG